MAWSNPVRNGAGSVRVTGTVRGSSPFARAIRRATAARGAGLFGSRRNGAGAGWLERFRITPKR